MQRNISREQALKLLNEKLTNKNLVKHSLAVEAVMRDLANHFDEDQNIWGTSGLLHDLDYEVTVDDWTKHGVITEEWLRKFDIPGEIFDIIKAHNADALGIECKTNAEKAIYAVDPVTGLITAAALMIPSKKINELTTHSVIKKFKNKKFAAGASREHIASCDSIGLSLEEFLDISLKAMQKTDKELGL